MDNEQNVSIDLAREFNMLVARAGSMKPDEILQALDDIGQEYIPKARSVDTKLETKRRVAEWKFKLLAERDVSLDQIDVLRSQLDALGFTNMEIEATIEIYFAKYLMRNQRSELALSRLTKLRTKLRTASNANDPHAGQDLIADTDRLLDQLKS